MAEYRQHILWPRCLIVTWPDGRPTLAQEKFALVVAFTLDAGTLHVFNP